MAAGDMTDLTTPLALVCLVLLISVCLNIICCLRQRDSLCKEPYKCCHPHNSEEETLSHIEGQYICDVRNEEPQENPHNHHERQENPIYGNISTERRDSSDVCYERMSMHRTRDCPKPLESDLNYASLDLKLAKKQKKHRHLQSRAQARHKQQDLIEDHQMSPLNAFLEVDVDVDAHLLPRDTGVMISQSSIYLNSQQIAQEAEEMEREKGLSMEKENAGWDGLRLSEEGRRRDWDGNQGSEERKDNYDDSNGKMCIQHPDVETTQSCADQLIDSLNHDGE